MPLYFYLLDGSFFHDQIAPALTASWKQRSFEPCRELCRRLQPAAAAFRERFHFGPNEPQLFQAAESLPFDRLFWRHLAGEILMFGARDIPLIETAPEVLCGFLAPGHESDPGERQRFAPIHQVHYGTRDLVFGGGFYRPEHAGWNDREDVERLCRYLADQDPARWTIQDLPSGENQDEEDRADELDFLRDWYPPLCRLYQDALAAEQIIACERIE